MEPWSILYLGKRWPRTSPLFASFCFGYSCYTYCDHKMEAETDITITVFFAQNAGVTKRVGVLVTVELRSLIITDLNPLFFVILLFVCDHKTCKTKKCEIKRIILINGAFIGLQTN